jgi:hypothetical protein
MTFKAYIWGMRIVGLLALSAWGAVIMFIDPKNSGWTGIAIFYLTAFFSLGIIFNLFLVFIRRKLLGTKMAVQSAGLSLRQGMLLAMLAISILILKSLGFMAWWTVLLVAAGIFLMEFYFLSRN